MLCLAAPLAAAEVISPEVLTGARVTFRLAWPKAGRVELIGRDPDKSHDFPLNRYDLKPNANGVWELTLGPLLSGLYLYRFCVDGVECVDPLNGGVQDFFAGAWSKVEVPDPAPRSWQPRPSIARGRIETRRFGSSGGVGWERPVCVYLPAGYDEHAATGLPVLYLLHGWDYNERAWIDDGLVPTILDNLIAEGRARPMVVVMPLGFSVVPVNGVPFPPDEYERWVKQMLDGLVPWVEATYRVEKDREHRAVAGFSMGGKQSLLLGLGRPDVFAWMGCFSSGKQSLNNYPAAFAPALAPGAPLLRLVWLGSGRGDFYFKEGKLVGEKLTSRGLPVIWHEAEGRHTWRVWRECFSEFAQCVFQPQPTTAASKP